MEVIYILYDTGSDEIPQVIACFSTIGKAQAYKGSLMKKQSSGEYNIVPEELDPEE